MIRVRVIRVRVIGVRVIQVRVIRVRAVARNDRRRFGRPTCHGAGWCCCVRATVLGNGDDAAASYSMMTDSMMTGRRMTGQRMTGLRRTVPMKSGLTTTWLTKARLRNGSIRIGLMVIFRSPIYSRKRSRTNGQATNS